MNHRQLMSAVARRFPDLTQRQVEDILAVMVEIWRQELARPDGEIVIRDFGKLTVEVQRMRNRGVIRQQMGSTAPDQLTRLYFRFRPANDLRVEIETQFKEQR